MPQTADMNVTGLSEDNSVIFAGSDEPWSDFTVTAALVNAIAYVIYATGIPGNVLSAIVWLRRPLTGGNTSAVYLAALAINDLVCLLTDAVYHFILDCHKRWLLCRCVRYLIWSASCLEALLVLSFSVVRLIAIRRPLQVCSSSSS